MFSFEISFFRNSKQQFLRRERLTEPIGDVLARGHGECGDDASESEQRLVDQAGLFGRFPHGSRSAYALGACQIDEVQLALNFSDKLRQIRNIR